MRLSADDSQLIDAAIDQKVAAEDSSNTLSVYVARVPPPSRHIKEIGSEGEPESAVLRHYQYGMLSKGAPSWASLHMVDGKCNPC